MLRLELHLDTTADAADLVDILLTAADRCERRDPDKADRWRQIANGIGDGLDDITRPDLSDDEVDELLAACGLNAAAA
jgi:hypothetical protein